MGFEISVAGTVATELWQKESCGVAVVIYFAPTPSVSRQLLYLARQADNLLPVGSPEI